MQGKTINNKFLIINKGWRKTMEDSHILKADFTNDISVFGVFDGHGGREVAYYVEKHFLEELEKN